MPARRRKTPSDSEESLDSAIVDESFRESPEEPSHPSHRPPFAHEPNQVRYVHRKPAPPTRAFPSTQKSTEVPSGVSDWTLLIAILFGLSIGCIWVHTLLRHLHETDMILQKHPIVIIFVWFGLVLHYFLNDLEDAFDRRRRRIESQVGPMASGLIGMSMYVRLLEARMTTSSQSFPVVHVSPSPACDLWPEEGGSNVRPDRPPHLAILITPVAYGDHATII